MEREEYKLKYPIHVRARFIHLYLNRDFPCIVYFEYKAELMSNFIQKKVTMISEKYPDVFCYKVGWESYKNHHHKVNLGDLSDVTLWRCGKKIKILENPCLDNIENLFSNAQTQINGLEKNFYTSILYEEFVKQKNIESSRKKQSYKRTLMPKVGIPIIFKNECKIQIKNSNKFIKKQIKKPSESSSIFPVNMYKNILNARKFSLNYECDVSKSKNLISYKPYNVIKNETNPQIISNDELITAESLLLLNQNSNLPKISTMTNNSKIDEHKNHY